MTSMAMAWLGVRRRGGGGTSARWSGLKRRKLGVEELREGALSRPWGSSQLGFHVKDEASSIRGRTEADVGVGRWGSGFGGVEGGRRRCSGGERRARGTRRRVRLRALGVSGDVWGWMVSSVLEDHTIGVSKKGRVEGEGEVADDGCR
jgi:hypothetical protein